jgi:hypothetical protein
LLPVDRRGMRCETEECAALVGPSYTGNVVYKEVRCCCCPSETALYSQFVQDGTQSPHSTDEILNRAPPQGGVGGGAAGQQHPVLTHPPTPHTPYALQRCGAQCGALWAQQHVKNRNRSDCAENELNRCVSVRRVRK